MVYFIRVNGESRHINPENKDCFVELEPEEFSRPGYSNYISYCLNHNFVRIGWPDVGDLRTMDRRGAKSRCYALDNIEELHREYLLKFRDIEVGSLVLVPDKDRPGEVYIGEVNQPYHYVSDGPYECSHRLGVAWDREPSGEPVVYLKEELGFYNYSGLWLRAFAEIKKPAQLRMIDNARKNRGFSSFEENMEEAVRILKYYIEHPEAKPGFDIQPTLEAKDEVYTRYQPIFSPENVRNLSKEDFLSFLLFDNNYHWHNLHRIGGGLTADMKRLRDGLYILVNEEIPIRDRLNKLYPHGIKSIVPYLGRAVATPILHVVYPEKYGVWNTISEEGLTTLKICPEPVVGEGFSKKYLKINKVLLELSKRLKIDLWHLDTLWWYL